MWNYMLKCFLKSHELINNIMMTIILTSIIYILLLILTHISWSFAVVYFIVVICNQCYYLQPYILVVLSATSHFSAIFYNLLFQNCNLQQRISMLLSTTSYCSSMVYILIFQCYQPQSHISVLSLVSYVGAIFNSHYVSFVFNHHMSVLCLTLIWQYYR